jgi:hypothetical protein
MKTFSRDLKEIYRGIEHLERDFQNTAFVDIDTKMLIENERELW